MSYEKPFDDKMIQMKATMPIPPFPDRALDLNEFVPGRDLPSPRRHDTRNWLHDHQQQQQSPRDTVDGTPMNKTPHLHHTSPSGQPPPPPLQKKRSSPSNPQPAHRERQLEGQQQQQQQQQQNASAFIAAFLLDAASVTVPTKTHEHDGSHGSKKKTGKKRQQRLMRKNIYGSTSSHDSDDISRSSSIDSLSECLDVLARSSNTKIEEHDVHGEKVKIETILTKTKKSGGKNKQGYHRLPTASSRCSADSDDDLSFVSGFSDWNEMVEKTFGCDDLQSETDGFLHEHDKHVSDSQNNGDDKSCCSRGGDPPGGRDDSRYRVGVDHPTSAPKISTPATATIPAPKSILKVKESHTRAADAEGTNVHAHFDELYLALDHSLKTSCNDSDSECFISAESKGNGTEKKCNIENNRLSSSMGDIYDMMEGLFTGDEIADRQSFECEQQKRSNANERAQIDRLRKKKAALHTRALHDSVQSKPAAHSPRKPRSRSNSYDDADSFLSALEEARAEWNKSKMSDNTNDQRQEVINFPGPRTRSVHQSSVKSLDAFDHMLAEIEEEERRMESALFDSKPKSRRREHDHPSKMSYKRGDTQDTQRSHYHQSASSPPTKVICLKWVDRRGMVGHYTGEVNSMIQPHGKGILVYENGLVLDCNWCNGSPSAGMNVDSATAAPSPQKHAPSDESRSKQFHPDYDLGMPARSRHDMKDEDPDKTIEGISRLKKFDFAFVRRSNEQWTYSIISDRTDDCIRFVVDEVGRTKRIGREDWLKNIHRIRVQRHHDNGNHGHHGQKKSHSRHPRRRSTSLPSRKKLEP